jgi:hypothetical protein
MITLLYDKLNVDEVRKMFEVLIVRLGMDIQATLDLMKSDIANANSAQWVAELNNKVGVYNEWSRNKYYIVCDKFTFKGEVWRVVQEHQSQTQFPP